MPSRSDSDSPQPYPAGLFRRLAALLYDLLLLLAVLFFASFLILPFTGGEATAHNPLYQTYLLFVSFFYFAWPWIHGGQTLGMKTWRMRVRQKDGRPLTWWHALLRFMIGMVSGLLFGLGFLWLLVDKEKRTWHDRAADTVVLVEPRPGKNTQPPAGDN